MILRLALTALVVFLIVAALALFLLRATALLSRIASALRSADETLQATEDRTSRIDPVAARVHTELTDTSAVLSRELPPARHRGTLD